MQLLQSIKQIDILGMLSTIVPAFFPQVLPKISSGILQISQKIASEILQGFIKIILHSFFHEFFFLFFQRFCQSSSRDSYMNTLIFFQIRPLIFPPTFSKVIRSISGNFSRDFTTESFAAVDRQSDVRVIPNCDVLPIYGEIIKPTILGCKFQSQTSI